MNRYTPKINACLVQLSYQIWPQKTTEGSPDCRANHWYNPPQSPLYSSRVSKRVGKITLDPSHPAHSLFELLPSGRRYRALSTRTTRHKNSFFPQAIHLMNTWHKTWNTQHYYTLLIHHTYLFLISNLHISDYLYTHNCLYYILCFYYFVHCLYVYLYIILYYLCHVLLHCGASVTITNSSYV